MVPSPERRSTPGSLAGPFARRRTPIASPVRRAVAAIERVEFSAAARRCRWPAHNQRVSKQDPSRSASTHRRRGLLDLKSATAVVVTAGAVLGAIRYRRDLRRDPSRLAATNRSLIETSFGPVEYAQDGDGRPVLIVHGVLGGCDFGVGVGRASIPPGYRIISPSRFGYLGSPMPADPSPARQADAFAALLDHLELAETTVVGFSAGSSSTVQLALRHPDRVSRLVLIAPNAPHPEPLPKPPRLLAPIIFSQPVFWAMRLLARPRLEHLSGIPRDFTPDEQEQGALNLVIDSLFPIRPRAPGTIYDTYTGNPDIGGCPLERISTPTLVIAAEDDTLAPYADTKAMARRIRGARLVTVPRGGHPLTHLDPLSNAAIAEFLSEPGPGR
jgi:pimeloyl-ACP methyl ester carboxylesterase